MQHTLTNGKARAHAQPRPVRRGMALICMLIGVLGCILPIIPGLPFFLLAARLLGPRDRLVRRVNALGHHGLRRLRASRQPLLRRAAAELAPRWRLFSRLMTGAR